jgi:hypothetical protein
MKANVPWIYAIALAIVILAIVLGFIWLVRSGILEGFLPNLNFVLPI